MQPVSTRLSSCPRSRAPVFVLGSPRSGTTLLYDMLLSAGGFAVYLAEANVFNLLVPRFGDLRVRANREKLVAAWLDSKLFRASGLKAADIRNRLLSECESGGDFLNIVMEEICTAQDMQRWAENSPEGMLYLPLIKRLIPNALFVHILRDGRDVAASLSRRRFVRAFPWEDRHGLMGCGIYWEWIVQQGRSFGQSIPADYMEVRFEHLLADPQETLKAIGRFIDHSLDYEVIRRIAYGSVAEPNTSFRQEEGCADFNPVGRWKTAFSPEQLLRFERLIGKTLVSLGYQADTTGPELGLNLFLQATRQLHLAYFRGKLIYKNNSLLRSLRPTMTGADIDQIVQANDHAPSVRQPSARP
jgi:hypothetical protein